MPSEITIWVKEERLSDGSSVFNVTMRDQTLARAVTFPAVTEHDAYALASKLRAAIESHTVFSADVREAA